MLLYTPQLLFTTDYGRFLIKAKKWQNDKKNEK